MFAARAIQRGLFRRVSMDALVRRLFANGEAGVFYDPSDLTTMYQDSSGTTPAAVNSPVGLILDKRLGLVRGAELVANGGFDTDLAGWTLGGGEDAAQTLVGGRLRLTSGPARGRTYTSFTTVIGVTYVVSVARFAGTASLTNLQVKIGTSGGTGSNFASTVTSDNVTFMFTATATTTFLTLQVEQASVYGEFDNISVKALPGNHASQSTSAARPMLRQDSNGKYYLEFDGVDDFLRSTFAISQPWDRVSAIRQVSWTDIDHVFSGAQTVAGVLYQRGISPRLVVYDGADGPQTNAPTLGANVVIAERHANTNSRVATNSEAYATGTSGTTAADGITIGARAITGAQAANIRFYGGFMIGRALTDAETDNGKRWAASKAGVTL